MGLPAFVFMLAATPGARADDPPGEPRLDSAVIEFFELRIRPLLAESCQPCHGPEKHKGGLRLDSLASLLQGGDGGPAITPGDPAHSRLLRAVSYDDSELRMPPRGKLPARQLEDLTRWVKMGAPWPGGASAPTAAPRRGVDREKAREHWAFQPVRRHDPPEVSGTSWVANPVDRFILARLEAKGILPNPDASPRELLRRVYYDLLGLPPTAEALERFERDSSPDAWERTVDELLARPEYGERWGRHWLDAVRYADTNGYERDGEKPLSWRYRDYVINAFNADKPYDRFVLEQIAGDELPDANGETVAATGFYRLGVWDDEPDDARMAEMDYLDDVLRTMGGAFLGLTVGCARCHDHKFDPLNQDEYYSLVAFLRNVRTQSNAAIDLGSGAYAPLAPPAEVARWRRGQEARLRLLEERISTCSEPAEKLRLESELKTAKAEAPPFEWALAVREENTVPRKTQVLLRGNASTPSRDVEPTFPEVLSPERPRAPVPQIDNGSTGLRTVLAEWVAGTRQPLTARVIVNRVWQHHFGRGIVETPGDFGRAGFAPTHPELLDWLASTFVEGDWSIKRLHRLLLTSRAYRRSSSTRNEQGLALDEANTNLWRQGLRRLDAEAIRDTLLQVSGGLSSTRGGRGIFPRLGKEVIASGSRPGLGWELSSEAESRRRSVYIFVKRTMLDPFLEGFDYANTAQPLDVRPITTVAPQALLLLNSSFADERAEAFADRLEREGGEQGSARVALAYRIALGRAPSAAEARLSVEFLDQQERSFAALAPTLVFTSLVPSAISNDFLRRHAPRDLLQAPRQGWTVLRGRWGNGYEGIEVVDPLRGPAALRDQDFPQDLEIRWAARPRAATEAVGVLFRARAQGESYVGLEAGVDPRSSKVYLRRHREGETQVLAEAPCTLTPGQVLRLQVECRGERARVADGESGATLLEAQTGPPGEAERQVGIRAWGSTVEVEELTIRPGEGSTDVLRGSLDPRKTPRRLALESFARAVLNLNELIYID